jgi:hypothetical protein
MVLHRLTSLLLLQEGCSNRIRIPGYLVPMSFALSVDISGWNRNGPIEFDTEKGETDDDLRAPLFAALCEQPEKLTAAAAEASPSFSPRRYGLPRKDRPKRRV